MAGVERAEFEQQLPAGNRRQRPAEGAIRGESEEKSDGWQIDDRFAARSFGAAPAVGVAVDVGREIRRFVQQFEKIGRVLESDVRHEIGPRQFGLVVADDDRGRFRLSGGEFRDFRQLRLAESAGGSFEVDLCVCQDPADAADVESRGFGDRRAQIGRIVVVSNEQMDGNSGFTDRRENRFENFVVAGPTIELRFVPGRDDRFGFLRQQLPDHGFEIFRHVLASNLVQTVRANVHVRQKSDPRTIHCGSTQPNSGIESRDQFVLTAIAPHPNYPPMKSQFSLLRILPLLFAGCLAGSLHAETGWPHETSDLDPDPNVTWGQLDSGLRYAILPNAEPPDRVSIRLYVDAGSLHEEDDQRGLAHFLEHMAFNGTTHFPAGEMVEYFQRLGMGFGSHTNAHTWWHETVYKLELPKAEPKMLDDGFKLLRDYADGILFGEEEIERERGVILSEKRTRDDPGYRAYEDWIAFAMPDTIFPDRITIGTEEVISNAPRQRFIDFYEKWYTADRMSVLVVGDVEVEAIEKLIKQYFESLPAAAEPVPDPDFGKISKRGVVAHHYHDDEATDTNVSIETMRLSTLGPDNQARRARQLKIMIATQILVRRMEKIAKEEDAAIIRGHFGHRELHGLPWAEYCSIDATCKPENWEAALATIDQELRRALQYGFTEAEMAETKANLLNALENQANSAATRKSRQLADMIVELIRNDRVFTHPKDNLERVTPLLESITAEDCVAELRDIWGDRSQVAVYANGKVEIEGGSDAVLAAYKKSLEVPVEAPKQEETGEFAYGAEMKPGEIAERKLVEDLEITQIKFANHVRANFKVTDLEADTIRVGARIGAGRLTEPKDKPGLAILLGSTFDSGGLEAHSADELQRILAGKSVGTGFGVDDDAFTIGGRTTSDDLLLQLQLMRAQITNPGFREEAERVFKAEIDQLYQILNHSPNGIQAGKVENFLHGGDPRFGYPEKEQLLARTTAEAKSWVTPDLEGGYLEIAIVGDFDLEAAVDAVARTFGTLPERAESKPAYEAERKVAFPRDAGEQKEFTFQSEIKKSTSLVYWPTTDRPSDVSRARRLSLLSSVMSDRIRKKIREELGDAYSPRAHNIPSDAFTDYGYFFGMAEGAPDQAQKLADVMKELGAELAESGVTEDEVERAKKPLLTMIEEMVRTNPYWLDRVVSRCQEHPYRLDWARTFLSDYGSVTKAELDALAKEFLGADAALKVLIVPEEEPEAAESN